jgi:predicted TIM-barrel fold metal-dependent hydrolase
LAKTERLGIEYRIVPIIDTHTHSSGPDNDGPVSGIVNVMDECGVEQSFVFAPLLSASGKTLTDKALDDVRVHNDYVAHLCSQSAERLLAFCVLNLNPRIAGGDADRTAELMVEEARRCYHELGIRGCKLVPDHWTAEDEHAIRLFEELARLGMYVVFHAGIFMDERSSSWCRPAFYEGVHQVEAFHGQLAHLGWPWVDECIAALLMQTEHSPKDDPPLRVDLSFGCPPDWQLDSVKKAINNLPPEWLLFGSDLFWPVDAFQYVEQYFMPQLSMLEAAATESRTAPQQGSQERVAMRKAFFYDNAIKHWERATRGVPQRPKRAAITPRVSAARSGRC